METIIQTAVEKGQHCLSEYDSKRVLEAAGLNITKEVLVTSKEEALAAAGQIGYPVVMKGCSDKLTHKTEMGMVHLGIDSDDKLLTTYDKISAVDIELDGVLIQEMIGGSREFVIGLHRDPQFGPCVMFGLGGIFTEVLKDTTFRIAPLTTEDAAEMIDEIKANALLGQFRGNVAVDREQLIKALVGIGEIGVKFHDISEIDVNPLIISDGKPVAVDGLVVLNPGD